MTSKEEDHETNRKMISTSVPLNTEELLDSDSDEAGFGNLALDFCSERTTEKPIRDSAVTSSEYTAVVGNTRHEIPNHENLKRSLSAGARLFEANSKEHEYSLNGHLSGEDSHRFQVLGTHLGATLENLKPKFEERAAFTRENEELSRLPESTVSGSLLKRMWSYSASKNGTKEDLPNNDNRFLITKMQMEIKALKQKNIDYETHLQEKEREISKLQNKIITQYQHLKQSFYKKTEIQKEIFEEMDLKCKNMEEKLTVERKLREKRETEISHIQSYMNKKEIYLRNQTDVRINQIEAAYRQEINTINKIMKQKDEELSQVNQNYNLLLGRYSEEVAVVDNNFRKQSSGKMCRLEEIKGSNLEQSLELKTQQLREAYEEISNLQRELNKKHHELENVLSKFYRNHHQDFVKGQLESMRQQINEILNDFEQQSSLYTSATTSINSSSSNVTQEVKKKIGDKEEAD